MGPEPTELLAAGGESPVRVAARRLGSRYRLRSSRRIRASPRASFGSPRRWKQSAYCRPGSAATGVESSLLRMFLDIWTCAGREERSLMP
jgi:hypothetical protein